MLNDKILKQNIRINFKISVQQETTDFFMIKNNNENRKQEYRIQKLTHIHLMNILNKGK